MPLILAAAPILISVVSNLVLRQSALRAAAGGLLGLAEILWIWIG